MKRWIVLLLLFSLFIVGCGVSDTSVGGGSITPQAWAVNVESVRFTNWVDSEINGFGYAPDPGYTWLLVNVTIKNLKTTSSSINWILDGFTLVVNGLSYSQQLQLNDPPGHIDTGFNPQQSKSGFIAFEVPIGTSLNDAVLRWEPYEGDDVVIELKDIPVL